MLHVATSAQLHCQYYYTIEEGEIKEDQPLTMSHLPVYAYHELYVILLIPQINTYMYNREREVQRGSAIVDISLLTHALAQ